MNYPKSKNESGDFVKSSTRYLLTFIRIIVGWHFLYEGIVKLIDPEWTSTAYLLESTWWFSGMFKALAANQSLLPVVDFLNTWGLILTGACLFFGIFTRISACCGS